MRGAGLVLALSLWSAGCLFDSTGEIIEGTLPSTGNDEGPDGGNVGRNPGESQGDGGSLGQGGSSDDGSGWADDGVSNGEGSDGANGHRGGDDGFSAGDGASDGSAGDGVSDDGLGDDGWGDGTGDDMSDGSSGGDGADDGSSSGDDTGDGSSSGDGTGDGSSSGDGADDGSSGGADDDGTLDVPPGDHCASVARWDPQARQFEEEVLYYTNEARARGQNCGDNGSFGPTGPLKMDPRLRCSARLHSVYMGNTGDFQHTQSQTGLSAFQRMTDAGYRWSKAAENIAAGSRTPQDVVNGWLRSAGHCKNIMNPDYVDIGIGYFMGSFNWEQQPAQTPYWTQNFGAPL